MIPIPLAMMLSTRKVKMIGAAAVVLLAAAAAAYTVVRIYRAGYDAGQAEGAVQIAAARLQAQEEQARIQRQLIETERNMRALEQEAADLLARVNATGTARVRTVERVIRENPSFAAIARPVELDRVRDQQLADIAAAAARGTDAAAKLPGSGIQTLRRPGNSGQPDAR